MEENIYTAKYDGQGNITVSSFKQFFPWKAEIYRNMADGNIDTRVYIFNTSVFVHKDDFQLLKNYVEILRNDQGLTGKKWPVLYLENNFENNNTKKFESLMEQYINHKMDEVICFFGLNQNGKYLNIDYKTESKKLKYIPFNSRKIKNQAPRNENKPTYTFKLDIHIINKQEQEKSLLSSGDRNSCFNFLLKRIEDDLSKMLSNDSLLHLCELVNFTEYVNAVSDKWKDELRNPGAFISSDNPSYSNSYVWNMLLHEKKNSQSLRKEIEFLKSSLSEMKNTIQIIQQEKIQQLTINNEAETKDTVISKLAAEPELDVKDENKNTLPIPIQTHSYTLPILSQPLTKKNQGKAVNEVNKETYVRSDMKNDK